MAYWALLTAGNATKRDSAAPRKQKKVNFWRKFRGLDLPWSFAKLRESRL